MKPKIAVILYKSKVLANGEHPLMLRVTQDSKRKYVALGISCAAALWDDKKKVPKRTHPDKELIKEIIHQKITAYHNALLEDKQAGTSPEVLVNAVERPQQGQAVFPFLDELVDRLVRSGKIGNAQVYKGTKGALQQFTNKSKLQFKDINQQFLNKFEAHLRSKRLADTSISVYFRTLRAVFSKAVKEKVVKEAHYPFKDFSVAKFNTTTQKRAITKAEIQKIVNLPLDPSSPLFDSKQYFLFSYYGQGINYRDIAFLKWSDVVEGRVCYRRAKTGKVLQFKLLPPAEAILAHYHPVTAEVGHYIFPILDKRIHITPTQIDNRLDKVLKRINKGLKEIARLTDINVNLTMYVARHTYATVLKKSGVAIPVISEAMGHENVDVTQTYLKSFGDEVIDEANEHLL